MTGTLLVLAVAAACLLVVSVVRIVPSGTALVVSRLGKVTRVTSPGLGFVVPALESAETVPVRLDPVVAGLDLVDLLHDREAMVRAAAPEVSRLTARFGVEVWDVDLLDIELRAGPELLRLMR